MIQKKRALHCAIALALGILGTAQYHRAQFTSRFDTFFGDRGDVRGVVYFCEHWYQWLLGKTQLMSPGIFYPTKGTLAYSDFLVGYAIPYSAVRALGFGMFSSMEVVVVLLTFLNYTAGFLLLRYALRFSLLPSCAGAMFFAFNSPKFFQTGHLQLQYVIFLPLIFACVILFARKSAHLTQRKAAALLTAAATLALMQAVTAFYYVWFLVFWSSLFFVVCMILPRSRRFLFALIRQFWPAMLFAAGISTIGFALFLISYLPGLRQGQWYRYDYVIQMVPPWWSLLSMGDGNYLWGWLSAAVIPEPWPATWGELKVGIGLVPSLTWIAITVWSIAYLKDSAKTNPESNVSAAAPAFLIALVSATTLFYLIGFNYGHDHSPWFFVYKFFPGAKVIRAVSRYVIFLALPMAIAFSFVIERGLRWASNHKDLHRRWVLTAAVVLLAAFGIFEQFGVFKVGGTGFSKKAEEAYLKAMGNKLPSGCTAFYIAPGPNGKRNTFEYQYDAMLISAMTHIPTFNASSSQFPHDWFLYEVKDPEYENNVKRWVDLNHLNGKVCRLEIGPQIEAFDVHAPGPLDDARFFVRQQFLDLTGIEPPEPQLQPWIEKAHQCTPANSCDRGQIAQSIFRATGFAEDGSFIYCVYQVALGRAPRYTEFVADLEAFRAGEKNKLTFVNGFAKRDDFANGYSTLPVDAYLNKLVENSGAKISNEVRQTLSGQDSRPRILLAVVDHPEVAGVLTNRAFVTLNYFGYLRRDPDESGYAGWLQLLERTGNFSRITSGFINSIEYRQRFFN
ncbi:MAG TPA: DUF4214 domain-containing protein [Pyrinomonadaceae bacterium]|nr:DUF4214 domain-containing protein [Pyrinomonadaceae bacterium]